FHGMLVHQGKLQHKQAFLFRVVDVANELFAITAAASRAHAMRQAGLPEAASAVELADVFCRSARRKVTHLLRQLWANDDVRKYRLALAILDGRHTWLERGGIGVQRTLEAKRAAAAEADRESAVPQRAPRAVEA